MKTCFLSGYPVETTEVMNGDAIQVTNRQLRYSYWIDAEVIEAFTGDHQLSYIQKRYYLAQTIKLCDKGLFPFWTLSHKNIRPPNAKAVKLGISNEYEVTLNHKSKEEDILKLIAHKLDKQTNPFSQVSIVERDLLQLEIYDAEELGAWLSHLIKAKQLQCSGYLSAIINEQLPEKIPAKVGAAALNNEGFSLTVAGWERINQNLLLGSSKTAFIAMAFTEDLSLERSITNCLEGMGWDAKTVRAKEFNDGIMDKVISLIDESNFVIADLTHQKSGVYFEAGYATGRGIPVIFTVNKEDFDKKLVHFDVSHLNLIIWEKLEELEVRIKNRVLHTIGTPDRRKINERKL